MNPEIMEPEINEPAIEAGAGLNPASPSSNKATPSISVRPKVLAAKQKLTKKKERKE